MNVDPRPGAKRRGIVLLLVLVIVTMLALGGYAFARLMMAEAQAARNHSRRVQARAAANSGVDYVAAWLAQQKRRGTLGEGLYDNPLRFHNISISRATGPGRHTARFSVIAPRHDRPGAGQFAIRYGVTDEASRLNLNGWLGIVHLLENPQSTVPWAARNPLSSLPHMTPEIADAILDWADPDDEPRPRGAESSYYLLLDPAYRPRNGLIQSLDELLMVRGVTPRLLYGEDANQNGILDANENDGARSYPDDNADGLLDRGWLAFFTLHSHQADTDRHGNQRIQLNTRDLRELYDQLADDPEFGAELARFVVAYRLFGPVVREQEADDEDTSAPDSPDESTDPPGRGSTPDASEREIKTQMPEIRIAGLDASRGPAFSIVSGLDLIDVSVAASIDGKHVVLHSPQTADWIDEYLDNWLDRTATIAVGDEPGRINVNTAPREVLMALPGLTDELATSILAGRSRRRISRRPHDAGLAWLLTDEILTVDQFKPLESYVTGYSHVFRIQVVGYVEDDGPVTRLDAVVDVTGSFTRIRSRRDVSSLGRGFDPRHSPGR